MTSMSEFVLNYLDLLKETHPMFRYPLLTAGDYEPYVHQSEMFYRILARNPSRFLIADDVGLGKTIEGIMIMDQLIKLRGVKRVLLVVPKVLVNQWVYELRRFSREWNLSVFEYDQSSSMDENGIYVVSIDTLKRKNHLEKFLSLNWDLILVDEIHKVGVIGNRENQRYKAMASLVGKNPNTHFLGMTATPHKGNDNDYLKRLVLIDPYLRDPNDQILSGTVRAITLKRNKDNVNKVYEQDDIFPKAIFIQYLAEPTEDEKNYYTLIRDLSLSILKEYYNLINKQPKGLQLLAFIIGRRSLSSPWAGLRTLEHIIENRVPEKNIDEQEVLEEAEEYAEEEETEEVEPDELAEKLTKINAPFLQRFKDYIDKLIESAKKVMENDTRIKSVVELVKSHLEKGDKVIVFTEYKDTANYIQKKLKESLNLSEDEIEIASSETVSKKGIEHFKKWIAEKGRKVLVATDVASEGLNLQSANVIIHYEIPLSIVRFEQRNGRVWRLKQFKPVYIYYVSLNVKLEQALLENYYNKLLSITRGTGSNSKITDALIYKGLTSKAVFDLTEEKEDIPIYALYNDPEKNEKITPMKIWEAALQDRLDDVVRQMIKRIKIVKDAMKKFALFEKMHGAIITEIDKVRSISGFRNRKELKEAIEAFLKEFVKRQGGTFDNNSIIIRSKQIIKSFDENRIGKDIYLLYSIIKEFARDYTRGFVVSDALDYNVYLIKAEVRDKDGKKLIEIPLIVNSKGDIISHKDFFEKTLPQLLSGNYLYADEVVPIGNSWKFKVINYVMDNLYALEQQFVTYRKSRGIRDHWFPDNRNDFKVNVNILGGIIGVKGQANDVEKEVIEALQKLGWKVSQGSEVRIEKPGEVRYIKVIKPLEVFNKGKNWVYTYVNDALVGVRGDV